MATLTVQNMVGTSGVVPTYASAAGGGDKFANDGKTLLHVKNDDVSPITVTITGRQACNQGTTHNLTMTVAGGAEKMIGPLDQGRFNDASGLVDVGYSAVTSVTVAALKTAA